ncbi:MAG: TlpA family protein disulfide reductase [Acidiferrobacterales bacterium]
MQNNKIIIVVAGIALIAGLVVARFIHTDNDASRSATVKSAMPTEMVEFSLPDTDGKLHDISEWRGKVIVLNFWATWCPPCRAEVPLFVDTQQKFKKDGVVIVGVAIDKKQDVANFIDSYFINYPVLVSEQDNTELMARYGNRIATLPYSVVMDRNGKIIETHAGAYKKDQLLSVLDKVLKAS